MVAWGIDVCTVFRVGLVLVLVAFCSVPQYLSVCYSTFSGLVCVVISCCAVFGLLLVRFIVALFTSRFGLGFDWLVYVCYACVGCGLDLLFS